MPTWAIMCVLLQMYFVPSFVDRRRVSDHVEMYVNHVDLWKVMYRFISQNAIERTKNIY